MAVLGDERPGWRPDQFGYDLWGCSLGFRFPVVKLLDYRERWPALEASRNPFATVVMAHLKAQETRRDETARQTWKLNLTRRLYEQGYDRKDVINLFRFIDWVMQLPEELEEGLWREIQAYEEAKQMPYITSVERIGIRKGIEQGRQEGIQQGEALLLRRQLARRFGELPPWAEERLAQADREALERWAERVLEAATIEEVFRF